MKRWIFTWLIVVLAACNTPGPAFRGIEPARVTVGKSSFDVRVNGDRAEAIRLNREWALRFGAVAPRALEAIESVSGCDVVKLGGDQALIWARLDCGDDRRGREALRGQGALTDG